MNKIHEKLRKLLALAERGEGGEKETAQRMLDKMLTKHGLTIEDISEEAKKVFWFKFSNEQERRLANQIYAMVANTHQVSSYAPAGKGNHKRTGFMMTATQALEFELHFEVLSASLEETLNMALKAFIQANRIFPEAEYQGERPKMTEADIKALQMAQSIDKTIVNKRLENDF